MSGEKPREIAVQVLGRRGADVFTEELLERALANEPLNGPDRHLCQELVYGITRWQLTLDWLISRKTADRAQKPGLQNLLRLGLYQIFWLDRIPGHAVVNVTVELAKRQGFGHQAGFVNAVLRGYLREIDATRGALAELKKTDPALGYSHPTWLVQRWEQRWGRERTLELLAWNNSPPKTYARINTLKVTAEKLLPQWREENVEYDFFRRDWLGPNLAFELKTHPPFERIPSFQQGFFYIQDPSTLLAVNELQPHPAEEVLDLCAAPGGKLTYIAQLMANTGRVVANDTSAERFKLVAENCTRLGVTCVDLSLSQALAEAANPSALIDRFRAAGTRMDRVLVDAPCSNTGVMRRRIDLRERITPDEIDRLSRSQTELLRTAAALLKPGGTLVYSTCSLEPEENKNVVNVALAENPWLKLEHEQELLPFKEGVDGAYVAKLRRD